MAMLLTKECDYAVRIVRCLSDMEKKAVLSICVEEHIPHPFAYKILKKLEHAGLVKAHRGSAGGYQLIKKADAITLLDIVTAVDNNLMINECLRDGYHCVNNTEERHCAMHSELSRLQGILFDAMCERPMSELV
jgi:Rrf2 family protein